MTILELNAKTSMSHLLLMPTFHKFSFIEGEVTTYNTFHVDGKLRKDFFDHAPEEDYSCWRDVQNFFFSIIKGKRTPLNFKITLSLPREEFPAFLTRHELSFRPEEIQGLYLNLRYDGKELCCITGTSMNTFTMEKGLDQEWDQYVREWFGREIES